MSPDMSSTGDRTTTSAHPKNFNFMEFLKQIQADTYIIGIAARILRKLKISKRFVVLFRNLLINFNKEKLPEQNMSKSFIKFKPRDF
ncbi:MULE domain-containing protein [Aphis craccivora]|uniref:MULE domain-containing protein n=1 Tax=Aphis craccivora TaxID=307492 RepID=A0A6G0YAC4_APHCR|nr:MULE domain-containing protein [Aphis craccivora]